ncbi:MAG TPA: hypothetical protein DCR43_00260 [Bacteroidales bacterium]|nr:MAG: hypothetical protein A2X09_02270 [Bacteroidetes bacterium GWF2_43_11]HAQ64284.1 hypothetical protein [Bacteroidales bacterium]
MWFFLPEFSFFCGVGYLTDTGLEGWVVSGVVIERGFDLSVLILIFGQYISNDVFMFFQSLFFAALLINFSKLKFYSNAESLALYGIVKSIIARLKII